MFLHSHRAISPNSRQCPKPCKGPGTQSTLIHAGKPRGTGWKAKVSGKRGQSAQWRNPEAWTEVPSLPHWPPRSLSFLAYPKGAKIPSVCLWQLGGLQETVSPNLRHSPPKSPGWGLARGSQMHTAALDANATTKGVKMVNSSRIQSPPRTPGTPLLHQPR